jgi:hypothetical protein
MSTLESVSIGEVWERLGGGKLHHGRGRAFWRGGDGWSVSVDGKGGRWFDFVTGGGGRVLRLVQTALDCDRPAALAWLESEGLIERRTLSGEERHEHKQRRGAASFVACGIEHWRVALVQELTERKLTALEAGDFKELERAASLCHLLENGSPESLALEFFRQAKRDPLSTARFIEEGRQFEDESQWLAAAAVGVLAREADSEGLSEA